VAYGLFGVGLGMIWDWFKVDVGFAYNLFKVGLGFVQGLGGFFRDGLGLV
jgi:hypothetical protein